MRPSPIHPGARAAALALAAIAPMLTALAMSPSPPKPQASSGELVIIDNFPSEHIGQRRVYIWLPPGHESHKSHQLLIMHDGQMLFDAKTTWNQQEWGVDEVAGALHEEGKVRPFIIVGIDNAGTRESRWQEYFPQRAAGYYQSDAEAHPLQGIAWGADSYLRFLIEEIKPFVALNHGASVDGPDTYLLGSSMGGLISLYALSEHPDEFAGAACLSTHWPGLITDPGESPDASSALLAYMNAHLPDPGAHRLYFDLGTETLDAHYPLHQQRADAIISEKGYDDSNWQTRAFEGHAHDEDSWRSRLHIPLLFLFGR